MLLIVILSSCQKHEWNNPFDPNCPKGIWTPTDFNAIQEGNTVKLSWSQPVNQISGFRIEKKVDNGQGSSLPDQSKGINQFIDNSLTGGKVHVYSLVAFAGENISNTVTAQITPILTADIITSAVSAITSNSATSGGSITSDGGSAITARGVCWSASQNPTIADNKTSNGTGAGSFTSSLTGLTPGATYYIRAYATNSIGTAYGNQVTTTTTIALPTLTTTALSAITATTATSGGNITSDGGAAVTARGVCWSTSQNPTIADSKTSNGTGAGSFTSSITGLAPGVTYYIRAYATNSIGTAYGNQVTTSTTTTLPTLTTTTLSAITATTATSGGNITSDGGAVVTVRGVCWSTSQNPTIADSKTTEGTGTGSFASSITGLTPGATYYIRAYATNSVGTAYGNQVTTSTTTTLPTLTTTALSAITATTATSGGNITSDGGAAVTSRGVCWSTSQNPTIADSKTTDGTGSGTFTSSITGLALGTTYYVRAYATNSIGTAYGNGVNFTTPSNTSPAIPTNISATPGDKEVTIKWNAVSGAVSYNIYWSTNPGVSKTNFTGKVTNNSTTSYLHTGLTSGTTYYYVVTAKNDYESSESSVAMATPLLFLKTNTITATGEKQYYQITVSSGQNLFVSLKLADSGYNDFYLYVKFGSLPTTTDNDAKSNTGQDEAIHITNTKAGTYYIMVYASYYYSNSSGNYTITASTSVTALTLGMTFAATMSHSGEKHFYQITVSSGQNLFVSLKLADSGYNDFYLYAKFGSLPTTTVNDAKSNTGQDEAISILNTQAGTYYIMVYASYYYSNSSGNYIITTFD